MLVISANINIMTYPADGTKGRASPHAISMARGARCHNHSSNLCHINKDRGCNMTGRESHIAIQQEELQNARFHLHVQAGNEFAGISGRRHSMEKCTPKLTALLHAKFSIAKSNQFRELTHPALNLNGGTDETV